MPRQKTGEAWTPHHVIRRITVNGGFVAGLDLEPVDGFNCLIGENGTGKTTILEFIRHVLGAPLTDKREQKEIASRIKKTLGAGVVRIAVTTKHGVELTVERGASDSRIVYDDKGNVSGLSLEGDFFGVDFYGVNHFIEIAKSPELQLELLDRFRQTDSRRRAGEIMKQRTILSENARELLAMDSDMDELARVTPEIAGVEASLAALDEKGGLDAQRVNAAHAHKALRERERLTLDLVAGDVQRLSKELDNRLTSAVAGLEARFDAALLGGPNGKLLAPVADGLRNYTTKLRGLVEEAHRTSESLRALIASQTRTLGAAHDEQEKVYRELAAQSDEARARAGERQALQKRHAELSAQKRHLEARLEHRKRLEAARAETLARIEQLTQERFKMRCEVAAQLSRELEGHVSVSVSASEVTTAYSALLKTVLSRASKLVSRIVHAISPRELADLVRYGLKQQLAALAGVRREEDVEPLAKALRPIVYELEAVERPDRPVIKLYDKKIFKPAHELSTGQACTAIFSIVLLESERPLVIDEPEHSLANRLIVNTFSHALERAKKIRQIIFATHNANVTVVGKADRVFALHSEGDHAHVEKDGSVKALSSVVETTLDGGAEAFLLRAKTYGHD